MSDYETWESAFVQRLREYEAMCETMRVQLECARHSNAQREVDRLLDEMGVRH